MASKAKTSSLRAVDLSTIQRHYLRHGYIGHSLDNSVEFDRGDADVRLNYRVHHGGGSREVSQVVRLVETGTQFNGRRKWFACPSCAGRCRIVYLGNRGPECRKCLSLAYPSQSDDSPARALSQAQGIRLRLGGSANMLTRFPDRPWGMHRRTYSRLRASHDRLEGCSLAGVIAKFKLSGIGALP